MQKHNSTQVGDYVYYSPAIGKGSFSRVYYGHNTINRDVVAIKKMNKSSVQKISSDRINGEINLIKKLDHRNIVRYRDMVTDTNNIYIITDYCNGGTLKKFLDDHNGYPESFSEKEVKFYMTQIKDALYYLVSRNIYHRDIKPQNIFLNYRKGNFSRGNHEYHDIEFKLGDFGFAKEIEEDNMLDTLCGTPMYMAPEILCDKKYHITSDLWSVGIIFYQLMYGFFPYGKPKNILEMMKNIDSYILKFPPPNIISSGVTVNTSKNAQDILSRLLQRDPLKRITWDEFFRHPWFITEEENDDELVDTNDPLTDTLDENGLDDLDMEGIDSSSISGRLKNIMIGEYKKRREIQLDTTRKKVSGDVDIIEDYCDRFSSSLPTRSFVPLSSSPISIPTRKNSNGRITKYNTYASGNTGGSGSFTDSIYKYISGTKDVIANSIDNIIKYANGE